MPDTSVKRPISVTIIAWVFILTGVGALVAHASALRASQPYGADLIWPFGLAIVAILGGGFMLGGANWARWLCLVWMASHVVISAFQSISETIVHAAFFAAILYFLLRPEVNAYFSRPREA